MSRRHDVPRPGFGPCPPHATLKWRTLTGGGGGGGLNRGGGSFSRVGGGSG